MVAGAFCRRHGHTLASATDTTMPPKAGFMGGIACLLSGLAPSSSKMESPGISGAVQNAEMVVAPSSHPQTDESLRANEPGTVTIVKADTPRNHWSGDQLSTCGQGPHAP